MKRTPQKGDYPQVYAPLLDKDLKVVSRRILAKIFATAEGEADAGKYPPNFVVRALVELAKEPIIVNSNMPLELTSEQLKQLAIDLS